jgi:hypothetical protein
LGAGEAGGFDLG